MKKALIVFLVLAVLILIAISLYWWLDSRNIKTVSVTRVRLSDLRVTVNTNGQIEAEKIFELRTPAAGICRRIFAKEGERLRQGQPVVEIDAESLRSDLAAARLELAAAEVDARDVRRGPVPEELDQAEADVGKARLEEDHARVAVESNEQLLARGAISRYELEQSRLALARAEKSLAAATTRRDDLKARFDDRDRQRAAARVEAAHERIRYLEGMVGRMTIRAPADGTLYQFQLKDGTYLNSGDLVGLLADLDHLRLKAFVDEPELGKIAPDAPVVIRWNGLPGQRWKARVSLIPSQVVSHGTRSVAEVLCRIENPLEGLRPNIHVDVEILAQDGREVPVLPRSAVFSEAQGQFVWVVRNDRVRKLAVETGRSTSDLVQMTRGLAVGDEVIVPSDVPLYDGMRARVAEGQASHESR